MTVAHNNRLALVVNADNTYDTRYQDGSKPTSGGSGVGFDANGYATLAAALTNNNVGTAFAFNVRSILTGADAARATLGIVTVSGTDAVGNGFNFADGNNLRNPGGSAGQGVLEITATDTAGNVVIGAHIVWAYVVVVTPDTLAPTIPTGLMATSLTTGAQLTFDSSMDATQATATPSGIDHYNLYLNNVKQTSPIVAPNRGAKGPQLTASIIGTSPNASATQAGNRWNLTDGGSGIVGAAEQCMYVSCLLTSDQSVTVELDALTAGVPASSAGLMVRESVNPGAVAVSFGMTKGSGLQVLLRAQTGAAATVIASLSSVTGKVWLRMDRTPTGWAFLFSVDGGQWQVLASQAITMAATVLWGVYASAASATPITAVLNELDMAAKPAVSSSVSLSGSTTLAVTAVDVTGNESAKSVGIVGAPLTNYAIVWTPGHRVLPGGGTNGNRNTGSLSSAYAAMDKVVAWDVNKQVKGFIFPMYMADLEGPTAGNYSGDWGTDKGFNLIRGLITHAKSYNPPRDVGFYLNLTGNGYGSNTNSAFPSFFVPAYLNSSTYGGGAEWGGRISGYTGLVATFWNVNFAARITELVKALYKQFGPDTPSGGIYLIDLFSEISIGSQSAASNEQFYATLQQMLPAVRAAAPQLMMSIRLTYGMPGSRSVLPQIATLMQQNFICMGGEDNTNNIYNASAALTQAQQNANFDWGAQIYKGVYAGTSVDHAAVGDWAYIANMENSEYGRINQPLGAVPPAGKGSGYLYDNPQYPGIMTGVNNMKASHVIWHVDQGQFGPNINNTTYYSTAPPNPTPGPAAGQVVARPHLGDVISGNTAYSGIAGPLAIPAIAYPNGWPRTG